MSKSRDICQTGHRGRRLVAAVLAFAACIAVAVSLYLDAASDISAQSEQAIRQAILDSAKQCAAIEGSYPSSLSYLEEKYGLSVNRKDYLITYEVFASNVMPEVTVTAR